MDCWAKVARIAGATFILLLASAGASADEVDDLLAKRHQNMAHVKRIHAEVESTIDRPARNGNPRHTTTSHMRYTLLVQNREHPDPLHRMDADVELVDPIPMHFRVESGHFSFLARNGQWVSRTLPANAQEFFDQLSERQGGDASTERQRFDIQRAKGRDNLFGTRKGLVFVPKGKAKLYARREETVDASTGQPLIIEHYNEKGDCVSRTTVKSIGRHDGVDFPDETETEAFAPTGKIVKHTKHTSVEIETD